MKRLVLLLPVLFLFLACQDKQAQIDALQTEVIRIHDEVMPKTANINRVGRKIKAILKDTTLTADVVKQLNDQVVQLTKADIAMTDWMKGYKAPSKNDAFEASMKYLNEEKVKIIEVRDLMNSSLANGEKLLAEFENK